MQSSPNKTRATIVLGIDPGLADTGFGIIRYSHSAVSLIDFGVIKTPAKTPDATRLQTIHDELTELIKKYKPTVIAVEKLFFCKNVTTAIAVGQARGVVLLSASEHNLAIHEFTPLQVKMAVTSYGKATKQQVKQMVTTICGLKRIPKSDDAADALAIALCGAHSMKEY